MGTLVSIADFIVLLLFVAYIPRIVKQYSRSLVLSIFIAAAIVIFAVVSFTANAGLIANTSSLMHLIVLLGLLAMAVLVGLSKAPASAA
jgi:hypothetical protein